MQNVAIVYKPHFKFESIIRAGVPKSRLSPAENTVRAIEKSEL